MRKLHKITTGSDYNGLFHGRDEHIKMTNESERDNHVETNKKRGRAWILWLADVQNADGQQTLAQSSLRLLRSSQRDARDLAEISRVRLQSSPFMIDYQVKKIAA